MIVDLRKSWMGDDMPCLRKNPEMFFFDHGPGTLLHPSRRAQEEWNRAKRVCADCPVIRQCARDNLGEIEGVWGGMDPAQRVRLRTEHARKVRMLEGKVKEEYAKLAYDLRTERRLPWSEIGRIMGFDFATAQYLCDWWKLYLGVHAPAEAVVDLELSPDPEDEEEVPVVEFPDRPPKEGDAWIRYGRRVVWGYYLGQTEDDRWYHFRARLQNQDHSTCWFKAEDVKLVRKVTRTVETRVGNESRIYGTTIGHRRPAKAG